MSSNPLTPPPQISPPPSHPLSSISPQLHLSPPPSYYPLSFASPHLPISSILFEILALVCFAVSPPPPPLFSSSPHRPFAAFAAERRRRAGSVLFFRQTRLFPPGRPGPPRLTWAVQGQAGLVRQSTTRTGRKDFYENGKRTKFRNF